ncbi:MAG: SH3 domain-containing protein [Cellvibrionaceae bacterium]
MKDLYRRNNLRPRETNRVKIHNCDGNEADKDAAFTILLNQDKKAEYDRVHATLSAIGYVRRHLGLVGKSNWRKRYGDFLATNVDADRSEPRRGPKQAKKVVVEALLSWPVVGLVLLSLVPLAYFSLLHGERGDATFLPDDDRPMYVTSSNVQVHAAPDPQAPSMATLNEFQDVEVDSEQSTGRWAYVRLDDARGGYVLKQNLARGSGEPAQTAKCREYGVWRPESGQHLATGRTGSNTLIVVNPPGLDALVKLKDHEGNTEVFFYVRGGETVTVDAIPDGRFQLQYAIGENYSPACGRFVDNMQAKLDPEFMTFANTSQGLTRQTSTATRTLKSGAFNFSAISNRTF